MGKSVDVLKIVLLLIILGYGGYWGWTYFGDKATDNFGGRTYTSSPNTKEEEAEFTPEKLTPWEMQNQELSKVSSEIFAPLANGAVNIEPKLKNLWALAEGDFKSGALDEQQAKVISGLIPVLKDLADERNLFIGQFKDLSTYKLSAIDSGMSLKEKKEFAKKELNRRWAEWVKVNREKVKPYFKGLS